MDRENKNTIANNLVKIRERMGYSVEKLGKLLGVNDAVIHQWETGEKEPTLSQGLLLGRLYGVPVDDLFCDCKLTECLPEGKNEAFHHDAWLNRISNRRCC